LLIACGLIDGDARFTSVRAKTLFTRCQRAFKPFNLTEAMAIINARNEYLHSGGAGFMTIPPNAWWPKFWAQAVILIAALDRDIADFVGFSREDIARNYLDQNAKNVEHRTQTLIGRAKQRLSQHREGTLTVRVAAEWGYGRDRSAGFIYQCAATCPACQSDGILEGDDVSDTEVKHEQISEDVAEASVTLTIEADYFSCPTCQLVLEGPQLVRQAGLPTTFSVAGDMADLYQEAEYGNDLSGRIVCSQYGVNELSA